MSSFSALTAGLHDERPEHDLMLREAASTPEYRGRFDDFPAGPRAGVCLHTLFEQWDFCATDRAALEQLAAQLLVEHGFEATWASKAADMVQSTLGAPLVGGACLQGLPGEAKLVELEFTYKLRPFAWHTLASILADPAFALPPVFAQAAQSLNATVFSGYLKGFIDLACKLDGKHYVLDWKSNRLDGYTTAPLDGAMANEHYYLQALIYCVALHRYLRWRQPDYDYERDFGGAIYVFLRGMDVAAPGQGVWHYRPPIALIGALEALLCGEKV
jgi:exodeoxyribonuclease V beta subunit